MWVLLLSLVWSNGGHGLSAACYWTRTCVVSPEVVYEASIKRVLFWSFVSALISFLEIALHPRETQSKGGSFNIICFGQNSIPGQRWRFTKGWWIQKKHTHTLPSKNTCTMKWSTLEQPCIGCFTKVWFLLDYISVIAVTHLTTC